MDKLMVLIEEKIAPPLIKISDTRYLQAAQKAMFAFTPYLILGSMFTLLAALPFSWWTELIAPISANLWAGSNMSIGLITIGVVTALGYYLGQYYHQEDHAVNPLHAGIVSLVCFMAINPIFITDYGSVVATDVFGSTGMFTGMIVAIISTEIYRFLVNKKVTIKMPKEVPPMVAEAFTAIIPVSCAVIFWWVISSLVDISVQNVVMTIFQPIIMAGQSAIAQFLSFFLDRILWFAGIHGSNVVGSIMGPIWTGMITENIETFAQGGDTYHMLTTQWNNFFVRGSVLPLVILMMRSKKNQYKQLGRLAFLPAVFNIAEPVMFGLPIVLNPILFVPWVLGYSLVWVIAYIFTIIIPIVPAVVATVPWTIPGPIAAFLGCNSSVVAFLFSLAMYCLMFFIWLPFFKILENKDDEATTEGEV